MQDQDKNACAADQAETPPSCIRVKDAFDDEAFVLIDGVGVDEEELEASAAARAENGIRAKVVPCPKALWVLRVEDGPDGVLSIKETLLENGSLDEAQALLDGAGRRVLAERVSWIRRNAVLAAIAGVAVVGALGFGIAMAAQPEQTAEPAPAPVTQQPVDEVFVSMAEARLVADGWTEEGSCAELKITRDVSQIEKEVLEVLEDSGFQIDAEDENLMIKVVEDAVCNDEIALGDLPEGDYLLSVETAPVAADGSVYKSSENPFEINIEDGHYRYYREITLERTLFEDLSADERGAAIAALEEQGKSEAAEELRAAAEALDGEDEALDEKPSSPSYAESGSGSSSSGGSSASNAGGSAPSAPSYTAPSYAESGSGSSSSGGSSASNAGGAGSTTTGGGSSSSGGSTSSGASGSTVPEEPEVPEVPEEPAPHVHSWTTVVDSPAWTENVQTGSAIYCTCGASFGSDAEAAQHKANAPWDEPHNTWVEPIYGTVEHPAVTHQECTGCGARG